MKEIQIFKFQRKIIAKNLLFMRLYWKLFTKITIYLKSFTKSNKYLQFYKNWIVVCTTSFHIKSNVIFSKKISDPPYSLKCKCAH